MQLPCQAQIHQPNSAAASCSTCKPPLHKQAIPLSISSWDLYGRCALSTHLAQQRQVILLLHCTCIGPIISTLVCSLVDPRWWLFSCCEDLNLNFHFPSGRFGVLQSTFSILLKVFPSPCVLFFGPERNYHCSFQIREPHISVPVALPRMSLVMLLLRLSSYRSGNEKGLKVKVPVICRTSEAEKSWWLGLIVFQTVASNIMVKLK